MLFVVLGFSIRPVPEFIPCVVTILVFTQFLSSLVSSKKSLQLFGAMIVVAPMFRAGALSLVVLAFVLSRLLFFKNKKPENVVNLVVGFLILCFCFPFFYAFAKSLDPHFLSTFLSLEGVYDYYRYNLVNNNRAFNSLMEFSGVLVACLIPFTLRNEEEREDVLLGLGYALGLSALIILFQLLKFPQIFSFNLDPFFSSQSRLPGTFSDPNALGIFAGIFGPYIFLYAKKEGRVWLKYCSVFFMVMTFWSGSRSYLVMLILWLVISSRRKVAVFSGIGLLILSGIFLGYPPLNEAIQDKVKVPGVSRTLQTMHWNETGSMLASRFIYSRLAAHVWRTEPLTGVGLGGFYEAQDGAAESLGINLDTWKDNANNFYLQVLAEGGIASGIALLGLIASVFLIAQSSSVPDNLSIKALIVSLVALLSGPHLHFDEIRYGIYDSLIRSIGLEFIRF